jgi:hypothetical protein
MVFTNKYLTFVPILNFIMFGLHHWRSQSEARRAFLRRIRERQADYHLNHTLKNILAGSIGQLDYCLENCEEKKTIQNIRARLYQAVGYTAEREMIVQLREKTYISTFTRCRLDEFKYMLPPTLPTQH